jgi:hypothetical protein
VNSAEAYWFSTKTKAFHVQSKAEIKAFNNDERAKPAPVFPQHYIVSN